MAPHHYHAVIWIDHREARVFHFNPTDVERLVLHPDNPTRRIHHKADASDHGHAAEDHNFLHAVVNQSPTPARFSSPGRARPNINWSSTSTSMIPS